MVDKFVRCLNMNISMNPKISLLTFIFKMYLQASWFYKLVLFFFYSIILRSAFNWTSFLLEREFRYTLLRVEIGLA